MHNRFVVTERSRRGAGCMSNATHGGKGDRQRKANAEKYSSNFDAIFKTKFKELEDAKKNDKRPKRDSPIATERDKD